jgi:hypothetical protein
MVQLVNAIKNISEMIRTPASNCSARPTFRRNPLIPSACTQDTIDNRPTAGQAPPDRSQPPFQLQFFSRRGHAPDHSVVPGQENIRRKARAPSPIAWPNTLLKAPAEKHRIFAAPNSPLARAPPRFGAIAWMRFRGWGLHSAGFSKSRCTGLAAACGSEGSVNRACGMICHHQQPPRCAGKSRQISAPLCGAKLRQSLGPCSLLAADRALSKAPDPGEVVGLGPIPRPSRQRRGLFHHVCRIGSTMSAFLRESAVRAIKEERSRRGAITPRSPSVPPR